MLVCFTNKRAPFFVFVFAVGYDGIFVLFIQEGDWTAGLQTQLLIFHLNEPLIPNASVIGSTAAASACVCLSHFRAGGAIRLSIPRAGNHLREYFQTCARFSNKTNICQC